MKREIKKAIREQAKKIIESYNPYIKNATKCYIGNTEVFVYGDKTCTKKELDDAYFKTYVADAEHGYNDRIVGYYDKWYRYNRKDEGYGYDYGVKLAVSDEKCVEEMTIIPA